MNALDIKNKRKELGLNQADLAKRLGVSLKTISNYENGEVIPESKMALLHNILDEKEVTILNEPAPTYGIEKDIIENLKLEIELKNKIIQLQEKIIELNIKKEKENS